MQFGAELAQLAQMHGGETCDDGVAAAGEMDLDLAPVDLRTDALEESSLHQPVDESDDTVMAEMQLRGELADRSVRTAGISFQSKKRLMLLRREASLAGGFMAKVQEAAQFVSQGGEQLIVRFGERRRGGHENRKINGLKYIAMRCN